MHHLIYSMAQENESGDSGMSAKSNRKVKQVRRKRKYERQKARVREAIAKAAKA